MNIFILDEDPIQAAVDHCDKHIASQIKETCQLLSTYFKGDILVNQELLLKPTHEKHPCSKSIAANWSYRLYAYRLLCVLLQRYNSTHKDPHAYTLLIESWSDYFAELARRVGMDSKSHFIPLVMPRIYCPTFPGVLYMDHAVIHYRIYYWFEKRYFAEWKDQAIPEWFNPDYIEKACELKSLRYLIRWVKSPAIKNFHKELFNVKV